jgi:cytosine/adenosine deaminase-related metal-dependent hydrolase
VVDFREQGTAGARMLRRAAEGTPVEPVILGRPARGWGEDEAREVLAVADGFGLSGLGDVADDAPERMAALAHRQGKRFALHFSEAQREDVGRALALHPDFLVHVVASPREDLAAIAAARVPVVACPRSNALFGRRPDVAAMLDLGIPVALGSDNAMFHPLDVLLDARLLRFQEARLAPDALLRAAIEGGARVLHRAPPAGFLRKGHAADFLVLAPQGADPFDAVFGPAPPRVLHVPFL